jgi:hypothetical protein
MPSARYYIDQARTLVSWARSTPDQRSAEALRQQAARLLARANDAHVTVSDLNPLLAHFNDAQMKIGTEERKE